MEKALAKEKSAEYRKKYMPYNFWFDQEGTPMTDLSFIEKKPIQKGWSCDSKYLSLIHISTLWLTNPAEEKGNNRKPYWL